MTGQRLFHYCSCFAKQSCIYYHSPPNTVVLAIDVINYTYEETIRLRVKNFVESHSKLVESPLEPRPLVLSILQGTS